jgi:hypothetical protein
MLDALRFPSGTGYNSALRSQVSSVGRSSRDRALYKQLITYSIPCSLKMTSRSADAVIYEHRLQQGACPLCGLQVRRVQVDPTTQTRRFAALTIPDLVLVSCSNSNLILGFARDPVSS